MRTYLVPFQAEEIVWNDCVANVEANTKVEAFALVENSITYSNPFKDFDAQWDGLNTVTNEVIETTKYGIGEEYNTTVDDVTEADDRVYLELKLSALDMLRFDKDEIYRMVEDKFAKVGLYFDITSMDIIPKVIEEHFITCYCYPVDYQRTWSNGDISQHIDSKMITPLKQADLLIHKNIKSKSCEFDRSRAILLPKLFDINEIDNQMQELKTDVVEFKNKFYIVGVFDNWYALWECEV